MLPDVSGYFSLEPTCTFTPIQGLLRTRHWFCVTGISLKTRRESSRQRSSIECQLHPVAIARSPPGFAIAVLRPEQTW